MKYLVLLAVASLAGTAQAQTSTENERTIAEGESFLATNQKQPGVVTTASGLQYKKVVVGTGPLPLPGQPVRVNYVGKSLNGTVFDASTSPMEFLPEHLIAGWSEGIKLMPEGSKYTFFIPGKLAFGDRAPNSKRKPWETLIFEVELVEAVGAPRKAPVAVASANAPQSVNVTFTPHAKLLVNEVIKIQTVDMNTLDTTYLRYFKETHPYTTNRFALQPDSVVLLNLTVSKGELLEVQFRSGGKEVLAGQPDVVVGRTISYHSTKANDTLNAFTIGTAKIAYQLKHVTLPLTRVGQLKKSSFKDRLLILAFSARFDFANILTDEDVNLIEEETFDTGLLIDGKIENPFVRLGRLTGSLERTFADHEKKAHLNEAGELTQDLLEATEKHPDAFQVAEEHSAKVAEALKGLPVVVQKCDKRTASACESADTVYEQKFTLDLKSTNDGIRAGDNNRQNSVIRVQVHVYEGGAHKPLIKISRN